MRPIVRRRAQRGRKPLGNEVIRIIVIVALLLIVASLGSALYYLYHDRGQGTRMVKALALRVALSASLIIFLVVSYKLGWIGSQGLR
jgi:integral membrane sensor domain MASE1